MNSFRKPQNENQDQESRLSYIVKLKYTNNIVTVFADLKYARGFSYNVIYCLNTVVELVKKNKNVNHIRILVKWLEFNSTSNGIINLHIKFAENYLIFLCPACKPSTTVYKAGTGNTQHYRIELYCLLNMKEPLLQSKRNLVDLL